MSEGKQTPGPLRLAIYDGDAVERIRENLSHGTGPTWLAIAPEHPKAVGGWDDRPEHAVVVAITGNGPTSEANAKFVVEAFDVATETGTRPREMADRAKALAAACERLLMAQSCRGGVMGFGCREYFERGGCAHSEAAALVDRARSKP